MEKLPLEMVVKISRLLTLQDIARCCSVCRDWREVFNQDCLWRPHCDPTLVEPLDSTPSVLEPVFVSPESETSTLTPISYWRLAFIKQAHFRKNWKLGNYKKENVIKLDGEHEAFFLSNTLILRLCITKIELWDVSVIPATFVAKADLATEIDYCNVFGTQGIIVKHKNTVKVFHVDPLNEHVIELKHTVLLDDQEPTLIYHKGEVDLVNGSFYLCVDAFGIDLHVIDLEKGIKIKSSPIRGEYFKERIIGLNSSSSSDNVIVHVHAPWAEEHNQFHCYIFSLRQSIFLPGPVHKHWSENFDFAIHGDYLAVGDFNSLKIYNCLTSECIFTKEFGSTIYPKTFNSGFIFTARSGGSLEYVVQREREREVQFYSLTKESLETIFKYKVVYGSGRELRITNDKFVSILGHDSNYEYNIGVWEASGQTLKRTEIPAIYDHDINQAFTRGFDYHVNDGLVVCYYW